MSHPPVSRSLPVDAAPRRPDAIRRHNLAVMLSHIHREGPLTRAQLTQRLGISRSTVGALVADLTGLGVVEEVVPSGGAAGVGRPSHTVAPHPRGPFALAVDIDVSRLVIASVGIGGRVLARESSPAEVDGRPLSAEQMADAVVSALPRLAPGHHRVPVGLGVSVPGTVDRRTGRVGVAPNLGWHAAPLGELLAQRMPAGLPITIGNDADLAVLAEHRRGAARDCADVVYLMGRVGVGAGIVAGGVPMQGFHGHAGEIGHSVVDVSGPSCHCGKRGCVETYVGDRTLLARAGRDDDPGPEAIGRLFADARAGDARALGAVRATSEELGRTIAQLVNIVDPQLVVLGGTFEDMLSLARDELESSIARYSFEAPDRSLELRSAAFGADSALLGAAEVALDALLADPLTATAMSA